MEKEREVMVSVINEGLGIDPEDMFSYVYQALEMGAVAFGATIHFGSFEGNRQTQKIW